MRKNEWMELSRPWLTMGATGLAVGAAGTALFLWSTLAKGVPPSSMASALVFLALLGFGVQAFSEYRGGLRVWSLQRPLPLGWVFSFHAVGVLVVLPLAVLVGVTATDVVWHTIAGWGNTGWSLSRTFEPEFFGGASLWVLLGGMVLWSAQYRRQRVLSAFGLLMIWAALNFGVSWLVEIANGVPSTQWNIGWKIPRQTSWLELVDWAAGLAILGAAWFRFRRQEA